MFHIFITQDIRFFMRIFLIAVLIILSNAIFSWLNNQPRDIGFDVPEGKLNSLSFAPFRQRHNPLKGIFPSPEEIDDDLSLMADKTHFIRTYSSTNSMATISSQAGKYGLKMIQGAWLGYDKKENDKEIAALIKSANQYPDIVKRVIVGNEVLLRGEMKPERLIDYIRKVKKSVNQPVSYADVWSMYVKYPQLIKEVDFITIHILPYWEDEPISVNAAPLHIEHAYKTVHSEVKKIEPGKAILIGETGWPSHGRQRGRAEPGVINQATFIRELINTANKNGFDYNLIEAFNQPWKSELEGVVGGNWGLYSAERKQVFPLTGPVYESPDWYWRWLIASIIVLAVISLYRKKLHNLNTVHLIVLISLLQLLSIFILNATAEIGFHSYSFGLQSKTILFVILSILMSGLILMQAYKNLTKIHSSNKLNYALYLLYCLTAVLAFYETYGLATYGRYLSFPSALFYVPVAGIIGLFLIRCITERQCSIQTINLNHLTNHPVDITLQNKIIGYALIFIGMALIYGEARSFMFGQDFITTYPDLIERLEVALLLTLSNKQLLVWLFCLIIITTSFLISKKHTE